MMRPKVQASMANESRCSCTVLRKATRRISQLYDAALAPSGLKTTQRAILAQIGRTEPIRVGDLAQALVMDAGALAHNLKPLERESLVAIAIDPGDRRNRRITLTSIGRERLARSDVLWERAQKGFETAFGRRQSEALQEAMQLLVSEEFMANFEKTVAAP